MVVESEAGQLHLDTGLLTHYSDWLPLGCQVRSSQPKWTASAACPSHLWPQALRLDLTLVIIFVHTRCILIKVAVCAPTHMYVLYNMAGHEDTYI